MREDAQRSLEQGKLITDSMRWDQTIRDAAELAQKQYPKEQYGYASHYHGIPAKVLAVGIPLGKRFDGVLVEVEYEHPRRLPESLGWGLETDADGKLVMDRYTAQLPVRAQAILWPWSQHREEMEVRRLRSEMSAQEWQQDRESPRGQARWEMYERLMAEREELRARHKAEERALRQRHNHEHDEFEATWDQAPEIPEQER
jgi:hypothetical protein